jgi:hypothetical protein
LITDFMTPNSVGASPSSGASENKHLSLAAVLPMECPENVEDAVECVPLRRCQRDGQGTVTTCVRRIGVNVDSPFGATVGRDQRHAIFDKLIVRDGVASVFSGVVDQYTRITSAAK